MDFCEIIDPSELVKYLNQCDLYRLSQVNHYFYNIAKPYLVKINSWINKKCTEFTVIYCPNKETKASREIINSFKETIFFVRNNIFAPFNKFPSVFSNLLGLAYFKEIKNGDIIKLYKLQNRKLKYRVTYIFFNGSSFKTFKDKSININGPTFSTYPPRYWSDSLAGGVRFENDVGLMVTNESMEYNSPFGCRYKHGVLFKKGFLDPSLNDSRNPQYIKPMKDVKFNFHVPISINVNY